MWRVCLWIGLLLLATAASADETCKVEKAFGSGNVQSSTATNTTVGYLELAAKKVTCLNPDGTTGVRLLGSLLYNSDPNSVSRVQIVMNGLSRLTLENEVTASFSGPGVIKRGKLEQRGIVVVTVQDDYDRTDDLEPVLSPVRRLDKVHIRFFVTNAASPVFELRGIVLRGDFVVLHRVGIR